MATTTLKKRGTAKADTTLPLFDLPDVTPARPIVPRKRATVAKAPVAAPHKDGKIVLSTAESDAIGRLFSTPMPEQVTLLFHGVNRSLFSIAFDGVLLTTPAQSPLGGDESTVAYGIKSSDLPKVPGARMICGEQTLDISNDAWRKQYPVDHLAFQFADPPLSCVRRPMPVMPAFTPFLLETAHCVCRSNGVFSTAVMDLAALAKEDFSLASPAEETIFIKSSLLFKALQLGTFDQFTFHEGNLYLFGARWSAKLPGTAKAVALDPFPLLDICSRYENSFTVVNSGPVPELPAVEFVTLECSGRTARLLAPGFELRMQIEGREPRMGRFKLRRRPFVEAMVSLPSFELFCPSKGSGPIGLRAAGTWLWNMPAVTL